MNTARSPLRFYRKSIHGVMVQQPKYYSKKINFPEPQCLRNDGKIYVGMANDDLSSNLFENKFLEKYLGAPCPVQE